MLIAEVNSFCKLGMPSPILMDWVVIAAYMAAAIACFMSYQIAKKTFHSSQAKFWLTISVLVIVFGLNKFLYFESCITFGFAALAHSHGWYELRRSMQAEFIIIILILLVCLLFGLIYLLSALEWTLQSATIAFILLLLLVTVRTISLHQIDALIFPDVLGIGVGINWIIELSCNLWIGFSALLYLRSHKYLRNHKHSINVDNAQF